MAIELDNSFTVPVPPGQAWDVLLDVERIAPCMPGASVTSVDGDEVAGQVKVKLGALSLSYQGTAKFTEKDQDNRTISIEASGKETRGGGTASATVHAGLKPGDSADHTLVSIHTSLNVTGRPAQFGRSLLPEVSGKLIQQFASNLEALIAAGDAGHAGVAAGAGSAPAAAAEAEAGGAAAGAAAGGVTEAAETEARPVTVIRTPTEPSVVLPQQEDSLDLIRLAGVPILKRVVPVAAGVALLAVFGHLLRSRLRRSRS